MTTRVVERRHREAALALTDDAAFSRENPQVQAWLNGEAGAPIGCFAEVDLSDVAELLANAEQPAPSAPAEFDPWEALRSWCRGKRGRFVTIDADCITADAVGGMQRVSSSARGLCEELGLTESPKGKEA